MAAAASASPYHFTGKNVTLYVDGATGNDDNDCTQSAPCASIGEAVFVGEEYACDDGYDFTVDVAPGSYQEDEDVVLDPSNYFDAECEYGGDDLGVTIAGVPNETYVYGDDSDYAVETWEVNLTLEGLTYVGYDDEAVYNQGSNLTVEDVKFKYDDEGVYNESEYGYADLSVTDSTFYDDEAGVDSEGDSQASVADSTFSYDEDGVYNDGESELSVSNSTFFQNFVGVENDALETPTTITTSTFDQNYFGLETTGEDNEAVTDVFGTILDNSEDENCTGTGDIVNEGYNVDDYGDCGFSTVNGSVSYIDPLLGALQDNGGDTLTLAIMPNSVAYHLVPGYDCPATDQRGEARPIPATSQYCDAGSYEYSPPVSLAFTTQLLTGPTGADANNGPVTVQALDADGLPAVSTHEMILDLSTTAATSDFSETPDGTPTTETIIPSGSTSGSLYFGDLHPTSFPISVQGWNGITGLGPISQTETVVTGPAATVTPVAGNDQTVQVGNEFPTALEVNVEDGTDNPVDNEQVTFDVTSGNATFAGDESTATVDSDVNGNAVAPTLTAGTEPGPVTVEVTTEVVGVDTSFSETIDVGPPTNLTIEEGNSQSTQAGSTFGTDLETQLTDEYGNPIEGATIVYDVTAGSANFSGDATNDQVTDASGDTTAPTLSAGTQAGTETITATVEGYPLVTTTFSGIIVVPGPAATIAVTGGNNQSALSGSAFSTPLATTVTDQYGNPIDDDTVVYAVTSGSARFAGSSTADETTGLTGGSSADLTAGNRSGTQTITATVEGFPSVTTTFSHVTITPPSLSYVISPFALDSSALTPSMKTEINGVAATINKYGETTVALVGYASQTGSTGENQALSVLRARAVKYYLESELASLSDAGVTITTSGKGATNFLKGNGLLPANRRVTAALS